MVIWQKESSIKEATYFQWCSHNQDQICLQHVFQVVIKPFWQLFPKKYNVRFHNALFMWKEKKNFNLTRIFKEHINVSKKFFFFFNVNGLSSMLTVLDLRRSLTPLWRRISTQHINSKELPRTLKKQVMERAGNKPTAAVEWTTNSRGNCG